MMSQPGNPGFCVRENHVAGIRHRFLSRAGAGRHPAVPVSATMARGGHRIGRLSDRHLRLVGLGSMLLGTLLLYWIH